MDAAWPRCLERLEAELPAEEVHTWLRPLQVESHPDGLTLYAPNEFVVDQVREFFPEAALRTTLGPGDRSEVIAKHGPAFMAVESPFVEKNPATAPVALIRSAAVAAKTSAAARSRSR